jgi:uncharacterized protein YkwD
LQLVISYLIVLLFWRFFMRLWFCLSLILTTACHPNKPLKTPTPLKTKQPLPKKTNNAESPAAIQVGTETYYEDGKATKPTDISRDTFEVIEKHYKKLGAEAPFFDARLSAAAAIFAENVPEGGSLNRKFIDFYLSQQGIAEPYPKVVSFSFGPQNRADFLAKLAESMDRIVPSAEGADLRLGIGTVTRDGKVRLMLTMLPGRLVMKEVPRQIKPGDSISVKGAVGSSYKAPRLVVTFPDGNTQSFRNEGKGADFSFEATLLAPGRYEVEVVAEGKSGPEVCGLFSVYAGVALPEAPVLNDPAKDKVVSAVDAEALILSLVNAERKKAGLSLLLPFSDAQKVARAYSEEMVKTGKVGHISAISGKPEDRLKKGGVKSPLILENVARSYSPQDAHSGLMDSPGHRANVLNPKVTHIGIGVAVEISDNSPPAYYVTECFIKLGSDDPKKLAKDLPEILKTTRSQAGLKALAEDPKLSEVAARYLAKFASDEMDGNTITLSILKEAETNFSNSYQVLAPLVAPLPDLDALTQAKGLVDPQFTHYGAAVTVAGKPGSEKILLILLFAGAR